MTRNYDTTNAPFTAVPHALTTRVALLTVFFILLNSGCALAKMSALYSKSNQKNAIVFVEASNSTFFATQNPTASSKNQFGFYTYIYNPLFYTQNKGDCPAKHRMLLPPIWCKPMWPMPQENTTSNSIDTNNTFAKLTQNT